MNQEDYNAYTQVGYPTKRVLSADEGILLGKLHAKYFNHKYAKPCSCNPRQAKQWINDLQKLANEYQQST